ncbi:hypothetical protein TH63_15035 [Rufibacter radiotolerans]|uniref:Uncharacterized protein n=1 Tax=Rufibacter radiotolerans TaxID=1379910 RepID=A0A0H4VS89_9BACT|nr:hypothetical protein [Rufibacter radiotolerans]AKQ46639.1 hypothetical protein TH63_15035 [Rufibacter radiotolerans]
MNTKLVMLASACLMGLIGLVFSFLPLEALRFLGVEPSGSTALLGQLLGALYLGFAMLNWMAKGILIGGIYARPLAMGNFAHFFIGAMALLKGAQTVPQTGDAVWVLLGLYGIFAVLFGLITFRHPLKTKAA